MAVLVPVLQREAVGESMLQDIYASDQDMYPAPLSYARLKSWVENCPDLCICFREESHDKGDNVKPAAVGVIIVLPIAKQYWEHLLAGRVKEVDIDPTSMFANEDSREVGLHLFHIERFAAPDPTKKVRHFAELAMESIRSVVAQKSWEILGYSALTATPAGNAACKRMSFQPTGYEEMFLESQTDGDGPQTPEMVCSYPGEEKETNTSKNATKQRTILARSEMMVRHGNESFWVTEGV